MECSVGRGLACVAVAATACKSPGCVHSESTYISNSSLVRSQNVPVDIFGEDLRAESIEVIISGRVAVNRLRIEKVRLPPIGKVMKNTMSG